MFMKKLAIAVGTALVASTLLAAPAAVATQTADDITKGNADTECQSAGYAYGVKLDTGISGDYSVPPGGGSWETLTHAVTLDVTIAGGDVTFSNASPAVAGVLIKAANGYDVFDFDPAVTSGGPLQRTITNGISHVTFCYDGFTTPREHLTVTKTAETSFHRTHNWTVDKVVDPAEVWLYSPGGAGATSATANWKVTVGYGGFTDSDFTVSGSITVENDGDTPAVVTAAADAMTLGADPMTVALVCPVNFAEDVAFLDPDESMTCTYEVGGLSAEQAVDGENVVTIDTLAGFSYSNAAAPTPVVWSDDPTTETNASVTLTDVSDIAAIGLDGEVFTAPNGGEVEYSHTFNGAGYEGCGDYVYGNVATLFGDGEAVLDTAEAAVTAHVQCMVFNTETAWAANAGVGTLPYNTKKGGNWATYVQYPNTAPVAKTYNVYAGQKNYAGTATVTPVGGGNVTITVDLTGAWEFAGAGSNLKIEKYSTAPSGNPSPGRFTYKTSCTGDPCTSGPIPVAKFYGIHLDVGVWVPDPNFGP